MALRSQASAGAQSQAKAKISDAFMDSPIDIQQLKFNLFQRAGEELGVKMDDFKDPRDYASALRGAIGKIRMMPEGAMVLSAIEKDAGTRQARRFHRRPRRRDFLSGRGRRQKARRGLEGGNWRRRQEGRRGHGNRHARHQDRRDRPLRSLSKRLRSQGPATNEVRPLPRSTFRRDGPRTLAIDLPGAPLVYVPILARPLGPERGRLPTEFAGPSGLGREVPGARPT